MAQGLSIPELLSEEAAMMTVTVVRHCLVRCDFISSTACGTAAALCRDATAEAPQQQPPAEMPQQQPSAEMGPQQQLSAKMTSLHRAQQQPSAELRW